MKTAYRCGGWVLLAAGVAGGAGAVSQSWGQSAPQPELAISRSGTNFLVSITNGVAWASYELYHTPVLDDPAYPWTLVAMGAQGQTNFTHEGGLNMTAFFFIGVGNDWDGDGIENYRDAEPNNPNLGQLTITIDSPINGETIN